MSVLSRLRQVGTRTAVGDSVRWPEAAFSGEVETVAARVAELLADETKWVHRRTELISFNDENTFRRQVAVHFQMPDWGSDKQGGSTLVPLSLVEKRVLTNFDVRDETGSALPMLTREQNARVAAQVLWQQAREALRDAGIEDELLPEIRLALADLAGGAIGEDELGEPSDREKLMGQRKALRDDPIASGFADELGSQFLMLVPLTDAKPLEHRVLKFSYDEPYEGRPNASGEFSWLYMRGWDLLDVLGLAPFRVGLELPAIADAASYHVEVAIPDDLVVDAEFLTLSNVQADLVPVKTRSGRGRVHFYTRDQPGGALGYLSLGFSLRPGVVWPVLLLSLVTTTTLFAGLALHSHWHLARAGDVAAALVVALPTFFAPYAVPGGHGLVRRMFKGLRALVVASALLAFCAAASLAVQFQPGVAPIGRETIWRLLFLGSLAVTLAAAAGFGRSWLRTR